MERVRLKVIFLFEEKRLRGRNVLFVLCSMEGVLSPAGKITSFVKLEVAAFVTLTHHWELFRED